MLAEKEKKEIENISGMFLKLDPKTRELMIFSTSMTINALLERQKLENPQMLQDSN